MARKFVATDTEYFALPVTFSTVDLHGSVCISFHCFAKLQSAPGTFMQLFHTHNSNSVAALAFRVNNSNLWNIAGRSTLADSLANQSGTTTLSAGTEYALGGYIDFASPAIEVFVNGISEGLNTSMSFASSTYVATVPAGGATPTFGAKDKSGVVSQYFDGESSEVGFWNVKLTDAEWAALGAGVSPRLIRPDAWIEIFPMLEPSNNIIGIMRGTVGTETGGTIAAAEHPAMIYPSAQILQFPPAVSGTTTDKTLVHSGVGTVSLTTALTLARALAHSAIGTVTRSKVVSKIFALSGIGTATVTGTKEFFRTLTHSGIGTASLSKVTTFLRTLVHSAVGTASLVAGIAFGLILTITAIGTVTLATATFEVITKTLVYVATGVASLSKFKFVLPSAFTITATGTATLSKFTTRLLALTHSAVGTVTLALQLCYKQILAFTAIGSVTVALVQDGKVAVAAAAIGAVTLVRKVVKFLTPVAVGTVDLSKAASNDSSYTGIGTVTLLTAKITPITLAHSGVGTVGLTPTFVPGTGPAQVLDIRRISIKIGIGL